MMIPLLNLHIHTDSHFKERLQSEYNRGMLNGRCEEGRVGTKLIAQLLHEIAAYRERYGKLPS